ncbi:hypothetical protein [Actinopolymorpha rutila]|uniref:Uncharacterized protein n=1 Tax=Actinopolymorpha rutila TaxID=446787 RepID=A0A852ZLA1_9ACTN|nr:hypothetical protein [Actinopolymorpha rutila]NYH92392.1 hypothetical protein [Actinopolymorpha rutila]
MSSLLYGAITRRRLAAPSTASLAYTSEPATQAAKRVRQAAPTADQVLDEPGKAQGGQESLPLEQVGRWQDAVAALVPAEVLALHGVAMSYGSTTTGSGGDSVTRITYPHQMMVVYLVLMVLAAGLYLLSVKEVSGWQNWVRAAIPVGAFVAWTMIQPNTAFDAFPFGFSSFGRVMTGLFLAVGLGILANAMAKKADQT